MKNNQGVTLIELMIAIVLSIVILSGFLSFYTIVEKHYYERMELIRLTENMRLVQQLLTNLIHSFMDQGCKKINVLEIKPYQSVDVKPGTEAFTINYLDSMTNELIDDMKIPNKIYSSNENNLTENKTMMISDCKSHEFFVIDNIKSSSTFQIITTKNNLSTLYQKFSMLHEYKSESYYVAKTHRVDKHKYPIYALFLKNNTKGELIEGINDLKIKLYIDKDDQIIEKTLPLLERDANIVGIKFSIEHVFLDSTIQQEVYIAFRS